MKYIIPILFLLVACSGSYKSYNTPQCKVEYTYMVEDYVIMEYVLLAAGTEVCTSSSGHKYHYMTREQGHEIDICEPMPDVVDIKCYANCLTHYHTCLIFHEDGYVLEDIRKFGQENIYYKP